MHILRKNKIFQTLIISYPLLKIFSREKSWAKKNGQLVDFHQVSY